MYTKILYKKIYSNKLHFNYLFIIYAKVEIKNKNKMN